MRLFQIFAYAYTANSGV